MKLTAIILTKNEEKNIERAIKSVAFCDEVIVIDDDSSDKTRDVAKGLHRNIQILEHDSKGDFAGQRNWAMEKASNDWILFLDADEEVSSNLKTQISNLQLKSENLQYLAYYIKRRDFWWGRELKFGETMKVRNKGLIRLLKKGEGVWVGRVHEEFKVKSSKLKVKSLSGYLDHYPHPTLKDFISDINYYSTIRAHELADQGYHFSAIVLIWYPLSKFILNYFLYLGFLDGAAGFAYAFLMSFHSFLVRAKLYQYTNIQTTS